MTHFPVHVLVEAINGIVNDSYPVLVRDTKGNDVTIGNIYANGGVVITLDQTSELTNAERTIELKDEGYGLITEILDDLRKLSKTDSRSPNKIKQDLSEIVGKLGEIIVEYYYSS